MKSRRAAFAARAPAHVAASCAQRCGGGGSGGGGEQVQGGREVGKDSVARSSAGRRRQDLPRPSPAPTCPPRLTLGFCRPSMWEAASEGMSAASALVEKEETC